MKNHWGRAMLVVAPSAFFLLRIVGSQLEEQAGDRRDPPPEYAADLLDRPELLSAGMYLTGLGGLALLWFVWQLRQRHRQAQGSGGQAVEVAWAAGSLWALLVVLGSLLGATAPVIAKHYQDAEGARLFATVEFPVAPLGLTLFGAFALGNGLASLRTAALPRWLAWAGVALGIVLVVFSALQPLAEPTVSRSEQDADSVVSVVTGLLSFGLVPLWAIAAGIGLLRRTR